MFYIQANQNEWNEPLCSDLPYSILPLHVNLMFVELWAYKRSAVKFDETKAHFIEYFNGIKVLVVELMKKFEAVAVEKISLSMSKFL